MISFVQSRWDQSAFLEGIPDIPESFWNGLITREQKVIMDPGFRYLGGIVHVYLNHLLIAHEGNLPYPGALYWLPFVPIARYCYVLRKALELKFVDLADG